MIVLWSALAILAGCLLFLGGFYTGIWVWRRSERQVEVPKVVTTEKVVVHEKPVVLQVPMGRPKQGPSTPVMGSNKSVIVDPVERAEAEKMEQLVGGLAEI